jgi:putative PIN family toxin of toxin-antitoxin system
MRLVLDTAAMVAAIRSDGGASRRLLLAALQGERVRLLLSVPLLIEYEAVMTRPEHLHAAGITAAEVGRLLDAVAAVAQRVRLAFLWRPLLRDSDDEMVLETAINGGADGIVTFNRRDFTPALQFGIAVLSPAEALSQLEEEQ